MLDRLIYLKVASTLQPITLFSLTQVTVAISLPQDGQSHLR